MKKSSFIGTFVLILFLMGVSLYLGYFIHMKFGNERESAVPTKTAVSDSMIPSPSAPEVGVQEEEAPVIFSNVSSGQYITSPAHIVGQAPGRYFFEASFPIVVVDSHGKVIGETFATAQDDWMTEKMVPFRADVSFEWNPIGMGEEPISPLGFLIFRKDNPSDLRENDEEYRVPVRFEPEVSTGKGSTVISKDERQKDGCIIGGCSGQICSDEEVITDCMYKEEYICFQKAVCERQRSGACEWTMTKDISACVAQF